MSIVDFDHVAIPAANPEEMLRFYHALGFTAPSPEEWLSRGEPFFSVHFGDHKINFHAPVLWRNASFTLRGVSAKPGCGDFCFVWSGSLDALRDKLREAGAVIEEGPIERVGGRGAGRAKGMSLYTRDPDRNLLEFIVYAQPP